MALFNALSGKVAHFNKIFTATHNEITGRLKTIQEDPEYHEEALIIGLSLHSIVMETIDYLFNEKRGGLVSVVKNYNKSDAEKIFSILLVWSAVEWINNGLDKKRIRVIIDEILTLDTELYWSLLDHEVFQTEKLWELLSDVLSMDKNHQEAFLNFNVAFRSISSRAILTISTMDFK